MSRAVCSVVRSGEHMRVSRGFRWSSVVTVGLVGAPPSRQIQRTAVSVSRGWLSRTVAADRRVVEAVKAGDKAAVASLLRQRANVNTPEADGTTALHWAVREDDPDTADKLIRAGADVKAANRYGVTAISLACVNGNAGADRAAAQGRRRRQRDGTRGRDRAHDRGADRQRRCRESAAGARRRRRRPRELARTDRADVGRRAAASADDSRAPRARRRRQRALEPREVGTPDDGGAEGEVAAARQHDAAALRHPRRLHRVREGPRRRRRGPQRRRSGRHHPVDLGAHQRTLRRGRIPHRQGRGREPVRQDRPHGALRRGGRSLDAVLEPAVAEGVRRRADEPRHREEAVGARRERQRAAEDGAALSDEGRSRATTPC